MTTDTYKTIFELGVRSFPWQRIIQPLVFLALVQICARGATMRLEE